MLEIRTGLMETELGTRKDRPIGELYQAGLGAGKHNLDHLDQRTCGKPDRVQLKSSISCRWEAVWG